MADLTELARLDSSLLHTRLLASARQVGGIYQLDFQYALVSTDDKWKADADGIALHSFLLATVMPVREDSSPPILTTPDWPRSIHTTAQTSL